jgi:hypothetical protein
MLVYRCGRLLGTSGPAAGAGAAALCVSHAFWLHSVIAEVYTANAFFLAVVMNLLLEWRQRISWGWLAGAAVAFGIGLANHLVLATAAPAVVAFIVATKGRALLTRGSLAWAGAGGATLLVLAVVLRTPVVAGFWRLWYGPPGIWEYLTLDFAPRPTAREAAYYLAYLLYQFPSISFGLGIFGALVLLRNRKPEALLLLLTIAVNATMFVRHTVWPSGNVGGSKFVFYITDYVVFSILCAVGADYIFQRMANVAGAAGWRLKAAVLAAVALVPPAVYAVMPSVAKEAGIDLVGARILAHRDNARFFLNPDKRGEDGALRFGREALEAVRPGAVIFADYTPATVFRYLQAVDKLRPDVLIRSERSRTQVVRVYWMPDAGRPRPTYVAALTPPMYYDLQGLTGGYDLVPAGSIIEVRPREVR